MLFELLAGLDESNELTIVDSAGIYALWLLQGALERQIVGPLAPDYDRRLAEARAELRRRFGGETA